MENYLLIIFCGNLGLFVSYAFLMRPQNTKIAFHGFSSHLSGVKLATSRYVLHILVESLRIYYGITARLLNIDVTIKVLEDGSDD